MTPHLCRAVLETVILGPSLCPSPSASSPPPLSLPYGVNCGVKQVFLIFLLVILLPQAEKPDCTERLQLQRRLGCRTFHWFLANIYPEMYPSERRPRFSGKARHDPGELGRKEGRGKLLKTRNVCLNALPLPWKKSQAQQGFRGLQCLSGLPASLRKLSRLP